MLPLYGIKHILVIIGTFILLQGQTLCQGPREHRINGSPHDAGDTGNLQLGNTENVFSYQNTVTTNTPIDESTTGTEVPLLENTYDTGPSTSTIATPEVEVSIGSSTAFDDLDPEFVYMYTRLVNIFNETQRLQQEWKKVNATKAVLLVGKSGSGKTSLVQTVAGNISQLEAKELIEDSGDFYIDDGYRIHNGFLSNPSVLADLIIDNETGVVFVDNPGFRDSAGVFKDLEIALNLKTVAESFKYVRIALVCPHSSLKKGSYRSEFTSFLERVIDFLNSSDHYFHGVRLIATKVKNSYTTKNKNMELVPDSVEVQAIANFLDEIKLSYQQSSDSNFGSNDHNRSRLIVRLVQSLLAKRSRKFENIKVFRSPEESGPLMNQSLIMEERESIRQMLLNEDGFKPVVSDSFGVAISATTRDSIDSLFRNLDRYIVTCTEEFGTFLKKIFLEKIRGENGNYYINIESLIVRRAGDLDLIKSLKRKIGRCSTPEDFIGVISAHIKSQNLTYHRSKLENIQTRYAILKNVEYLTTKNYFSPENWMNALKSVEKIFENEYLYQSMLQETFLRLREYTIEKRKTSTLGNESITSNPEFEINPEDVINELGLSRYAGLEYNREKLDEFNRIVIRTFTIDEKNVRCDKNMLVIFGKFVFVSEILEQLPSCSYVDSIVILAADTTVFDADLNAEFLEGRNVMIVAPQWVVQGKRSLVVSGKPHEGKHQKAREGEVGMDGKDGNPSGSFVGIGLHFKGIEDLTVEACGGNGQDGQDGGDGKDGVDGKDNAFVQVGREREIDILAYNLERTVVRKEGQSGTAGQDSGAGGQGGRGAAKGSINIIDLAHHPSQNIGYSSLSCEGQPGLTGADGRPGNSGSNGCSSINVSKTHQFFGIKMGTDSQTELLPCTKNTAKGEVLRQRRLNSYVPIQRKGTLAGLTCTMFARFRLYVSDNKYYRSKLTLRSIEEFKKFVSEKLCP